MLFWSIAWYSHTRVYNIWNSFVFLPDFCEIKGPSICSENAPFFPKCTPSPYFLFLASVLFLLKSLEYHPKGRKELSWKILLKIFQSHSHTPVTNHLYIFEGCSL